MNDARSPNPHQADSVASVPAGGSDKAFGIVFCVVFLLVALYPLVGGSPIRLWSLGVAALFLAAAFLAPRLLAPLNLIWTKFGLLLHRIVSPIALLIVFCLAVIPTGLLVRLRGKDLLRLRLEPDAKTYWIERDPPGRSDQQMKKQF